RTVMKKLTNVKQICRNPGQKMSYFLIIIKGKGQLLIMAEYLIAHIPLNPGSHYMSVVSNIKIAERLDQYQQDHKDPQLHDHSSGHVYRQIYNITGNIPDDERDHQGNGRPQYGIKHI